MRFAKDMHLRRPSREERLELTRQCFVYAHERKRSGVPLFILGAACDHGKQAERSRELRVAFNEMCRDFCDNHAETVFIDVDQLLDPEEFADSDHYTRTGYFKIADFINKNADLFVNPAEELAN